MCGITGFVNLNGEKPSLTLLKKMTEAIAYRGPDDRGLEISDNCALGNRRLAVVDLSFRGHQPMWDKKRKLCLTFNGEIYNFRQLRKELEKKGYRFISESDTEVILNLFQEEGPSCVRKLRGMFALAIWDAEKKELFLAKDHFGLKPLHYFFNDKVFIFASEIKSILLHSQVKKVINPRALSHYFSLGFGCIASPETIFLNIYKLSPGHYAILRGRKLIIRRYWDLNRIKPKKMPLSEAVAETKRLLERSISSQLVADVSVGVFLSGGIDSSLIASMAQKMIHQPLKTFSIGFKNRQFDESAYASRMAKYLRTEHHYRNFSIKELLATLPKVVEKLDEPLADASILPTYLLSKYTRKYVTVALSGDGGDELFAGYPTYLAHRFAQKFSYLPSSALAIFRQILTNSGPLINTLPFFKHSPNLSINFKLNRFFRGINKDPIKQHLNFMGPLVLEEKDCLINHHQEAALSLAKSLVAGVKNRDLQTKLQYLDFKLYLGEDCLVKTDRASSFNSLEVRAPFLDVDLVEFVFSLPADYKLHRLTLKYLLKKVAQGKIPSEIINRPKKGFGIPTHIWLKTQLQPTLKSLLGKKRLEKQGLFNSEFVSRLLKEHFQGAADHRMVLWNLFIFQLWYDQWFR